MEPYAPMALYEHRPAVKTLVQGCEELGQAPLTAKALLAYLFTKRRLLDSPNPQERAQAEAMCPEPHVDALWQWMLLNNPSLSVADEVHALVGGPVPHRTITQRDPEHVKQARRANAAALMRRFGLLPPAGNAPAQVPPAAAAAAPQAAAAVAAHAAMPVMAVPAVAPAAPAAAPAVAAPQANSRAAAPVAAPAAVQAGVPGLAPEHYAAQVQQEQGSPGSKGCTTARSSTPRCCSGTHGWAAGRPKVGRGCC